MARVHSDDDVQALLSQEHITRLELNDWLNKEEVMWVQRSKQMWLLNGDKNTSYFHSLVRQRKAKNTVTRILGPNRNWIVNYDDLEHAVDNFFSSIFRNNTLPREPSNWSWLKRLPILSIDTPQKDSLMLPVQSGEIKNVFFFFK